MLGGLGGGGAGVGGMHGSQHESDSGYSVTSGSPGANSQEGNLDTEAGPDIGEFQDSEFRPATEVFSDLDYLSSHGTASSSVSSLARQSLYAKFDPLIGGRPSVLSRPSMAAYKHKVRESQEGRERESDLIAMNSPSPAKSDNRPQARVPGGGGAGEGGSQGRQEADTQEAKVRELEFQEGLLQREREYAELEKELKEREQELQRLKEELKSRRESEDQMKQVLKEYEKTISELIADKERDKTKLEEDIQVGFSVVSVIYDIINRKSWLKKTKLWKTYRLWRQPLPMFTENMKERNR